MQIKLFVVLVTVIACSIFVIRVSGQSPAPQVPVGTIGGTVIDSSGAKIPGVMVTLQSVATGFSAKVLTNEIGAFRFVNVVPGNGYTLTAELQGFMPTGFGSVRLDANQELLYRLSMNLGSSGVSVPVNPVHPFSGSGAVNITADSNTKVGLVIQYRGHVWMSSDSFEVSADEVDFNINTQLADMRGNVKMRMFQAGSTMRPIQ